MGGDGHLGLVRCRNLLVLRQGVFKPDLAGLNLLDDVLELADCLLEANGFIGGSLCHGWKFNGCSCERLRSV